MLLRCPICAKALIKVEKRYACSNSHSFDIAKQGYINLLLCEQKKTNQPGDNKEMVKSRLQFLNKHHYLPVANMLNSLIKKNVQISQQNPIHIADLGCGVGYYLCLLKEHLSQLTPKT